MQQIQCTLRNNVHNPDPRKQLLDDLTEFILKKRGEGCEIILMMDVNESMKPEKGITKFIAKNSLEDIHAHVMSKKPETSRAGSNKVLDVTLCTRGTLPYIRAGGFCAIDVGLSSDHILIWFDLDAKSFFGGVGPSYVPPQHREFSFENEKIRGDFLTALLELFTKQDIEKQVNELMQSFQKH